MTIFVVSVFKKVYFQLFRYQITILSNVITLEQKTILFKNCILINDII